MKNYSQNVIKAVKGPPQVVKAKVGKPLVFTGKSSELSPQLTYLKLDFRLQKINDIESKILYAASWLNGDLNLWFTGIIKDYFNNVKNKRHIITNKIFDADKRQVNFETEITKMYGKRDEQKQAEDCGNYVR